MPDIADSGNWRQRFLLFSYLDFRVCFACYPPKSFKTICLTCIWLKFVDISFHSMQKHPKYFSLRTAIFLHFWKIVAWSSKLAGGWNKAHNSLKLLTSCGPNLEVSRSNVIFCDFFFRSRCRGINGPRRRRQWVKFRSWCSSEMGILQQNVHQQEKNEVPFSAWKAHSC